MGDVNQLGSHKPGQVSIGGYVDEELRDYLDKIVDERGFLCRSDALRAILYEHRAVFSKGIDRNQVLTPLEVVVNNNHSAFLHRKRKLGKNYSIIDFVSEMRQKKQKQY